MDDLQLFIAAEKVIEVVENYVVPEMRAKIPFDKRGLFEIDPNRGQSTGIMIMFSHQRPREIMTPWGSCKAWTVWTVPVGELTTLVHNRLVKELDLTLVRESPFAVTLYAVGSVEGLKLPQAKEKPLDEFLPADYARRIWSELRREAQEH